ncbi:hypothetical protein ACU4GA_24245 [Methylobacterium oryzae CBMB20]
MRPGRLNRVLRIARPSAADLAAIFPAAPRRRPRRAGPWQPWPNYLGLGASGAQVVA